MFAKKRWIGAVVDVTRWNITVRKNEMSVAKVSRYPVPDIDDLPEDIKEKVLAVQEKAGFVPNVFLVLAHRPDELRAFFAYHDALMEKESGLTNTNARGF